MNKLIKLLDQRAVDYAMSVCDANGVYKGKEYLTVVKEKFAELIINECIDQVAGTKIVGQLSGDKFAELSESADNKYTQWNNALVIATMNVRDHFGVKE